MKIALVTNKLFTGGGLEHIYQICLGIPNIQFGVFGDDGDGVSKFKHLHNVVVFNNGYKAKDIVKFNPNIIHFHSLMPLLKLYKLEYKKIITIHGIHLHKYEFSNTLKSKIFYYIRLRLEKYLYSKVDKIITVSDDDEKYLISNHGYKSRIIYNGIDTENIDTIKETKLELKKEFNFPKDKIICITVARFDFPKDYNMLVDAISIVNKQSDKYMFYFIGDGDTKKEIEKKVNNLNIENITFMGTRKDVYKIMKASDLFILPSKWEGLPISAIEALASKLKLLLSDTYGNRTIYKYNEENVELFDISNSQNLANKIIKSNLKFIENKNFFTIDKMINNIELEYNGSF
jgi:glycosyltransferase involved in cell wall biosynthesis